MNGMNKMDQKIKPIAMYLPQFHEVKENNEWWGEGFTEWKAMDAAESLFEGHKQPKRPLNGYRYDLMDKTVMEWQANLIHKYGLYGLCFYHYWFKDGRQILEKPAENLLKWTDIDLPFCFCWANESWVRSWSCISNQNVWASKFEKDGVRTGTGVLLEQKYGYEKEWLEHYQYFSQFFHDSRYICKDNRPVLLLYKPTDIICLSEMTEYWQRLAKEDGFDGLYMIGAFCDARSKKILDAELLQEPMSTIQREFHERFTNKEYPDIARVLNYEEVYQASLDYCGKEGKVYWGGFSNYDDTPRRGNAGTIIQGDSVEKFQAYLTELYAKNVAYGNEYVFVNAWNEWGEGMYLEPDEDRKDGFLKAFVFANNAYGAFVDKYSKKRRFAVNKCEKTDITKERYFQENKIYDKWLRLKETQINLAEYISTHFGNKIAIYGLGALGKHLLKELENTSVVVAYCIDRNADGINISTIVCHPNMVLPEVDVVVVSTVHVYDEVRKLLIEKGVKKIISLERIIIES